MYAILKLGYCYENLTVRTANSSKSMNDDDKHKMLSHKYFAQNLFETAAVFI